MSQVEHLFTEDQAAEYLQLTPRFLQDRRLRGNGPPFVKISRRAVRYRFEDLVTWVEARVRTSTSDSGMMGGGK